ncbi:MAG: EamA family transporter [Alphaproteobacteria bacterium]|nr:EamA family transporter [Alphaproteobacteria bacterium]
MRGGLVLLKTERFGLYVLRAALGLVGMPCSFFAIILLPLSVAVAMAFTAPLWATIGAATILKETVRARRWTAVTVGLIGVVIVVRPGAEAITLGAIIGLTHGVFQAAGNLVVKVLARTERPGAIVTYMVLLLTPLSLIPALFFWQPPTWAVIGWVLALGGVGTVGHLWFTRAFTLADASAITPLNFAQLPFMAVIAFLAFHEVPTLWTWLGGSVIFASTVYIAHREAVVARRARAVAAAKAQAERRREGEGPSGG